MLVDFVWAFFLGNMIKLLNHIDYHPLPLLVDIVLFFIVLHTCRNKHVGIFASAFGFAFHEQYFSSIGTSLGLIYPQYPPELAFSVFIITVVLVYFLFFTVNLFNIIWTRVSKK